MYPYADIVEQTVRQVGPGLKSTLKATMLKTNVINISVLPRRETDEAKLE